MSRKSAMLLCTLFVLMLIASILAPTVLASNENVTVYITDTGLKYHREDCTYLKSKKAVTLKYAVDHGYTSCSRCHPAILGEDRSNDDDSYIQPEDYSPSTSSGSHSGTTSKTNSTPLEPEDKASPKVTSEEEVNDKNDVFEYIAYGLIILIFTPVGWFFVFLVTSFFARFQKVPTARSASFQYSTNYKKCRADLLEKYANKSLDDFAPIPHGVTFDQSGKPRGPGRGKWGWNYTFYRSRKGKCFHSSPSCNRKAAIPIHALSLSGLRPCKRFKPMLPDLTWYYKREEIKRECRYYGITIPEHPPQIESPKSTPQVDGDHEQLSLF